MFISSISSNLSIISQFHGLIERDTTDWIEFDNKILIEKDLCEVNDKGNSEDSIDDSLIFEESEQKEKITKSGQHIQK